MNKLENYKCLILKIYKSGLPDSSRELVYQTLLEETKKYGITDLWDTLGIDTAFDRVFHKCLFPKIERMDFNIKSDDFHSGC